MEVLISESALILSSWLAKHSLTSQWWIHLRGKIEISHFKITIEDTNIAVINIFNGNVTRK